MENQREVYSGYKKRHTYKYTIVCIKSKKVIIFVDGLYNEHMHDVQMIKECDLEDMLDIDEILIADKKYTNLEKIWNEKYVNLDSLDKFRKERVEVENTICDIKNYASVSNT